MTTIKYKKGNTWEEISAYCTSGSNVQERIDQAFGVGATTCFLNLSKNIAPYTLLNIDDKYYVGYSSCNKYVQSTKFYLHKLYILPLEAYLAGFVIGTKSFSTSGTNKTDADKVKIIINMINDMEAGITLDDIDDYLTKSIEYQYGAGSTAWDIISDICKHNEVRPILTYDADNGFTFGVQNIIGTRKTLNRKYLSNAEYTQSMDDYCNKLVTEANNIVDRTTLTYVNNLTCRSDDVICSTDNAKLFLPSSIESVVGFGMSNLVRDCWWEIEDFTIYKSDGTAYTNREYTGTIGTLMGNGKNPMLAQVYDTYFKNFYATIDLFKACIVTYNNDSYDGYYRLLHTNGIQSENKAQLSMKQSMIDYILPKEKWDMLTDQQKTSYAFYDHGSETIENMFGTYKDDLFNILLGNYGSPMLSITFPTIAETVTKSGYVIHMHIKQSKPTESTTEEPHSTNPVDYVWYVDYYPITNAKITTSKTTDPFNENVWKNIQRSYNNGSSYIDFDKLITSLMRENNMMGDVELTVELTVPEGYEVDYYAGDSLLYDPSLGPESSTLSMLWYISSVITTHRLEYKTIVLNLVRDYSKVAECIGVDTQYNATKNPLNSIIDRPIEFDGSRLVELKTGQDYYFKLDFYDANSKLIKTCYKVATVLQDDAKNTVFTCKADSQYSFGIQLGEQGGTSGSIKTKLIKTWKQIDIPYVDTNSECKSVSCTIVSIPSLTYDQSKLLPVYTGTSTAVTSLVSLDVYKDARERLLFSYVCYAPAFYEFIMYVSSYVNFRCKFIPGNTFRQYVSSRYNTMFSISNGYLYYATGYILLDANLDQVIQSETSYIFGKLNSSVSISLVWTKLGVNVTFTDTYKIKFYYRIVMDDEEVAYGQHSGATTFTDVYESSNSFSEAGKSHTCNVEVFAIIDNVETMKFTSEYYKTYYGTKISLLYYTYNDSVKDDGLEIRTDFSTEDTDSIWYLINDYGNYTRTMSDAYYSSSNKTVRQFKLYDVVDSSSRESSYFNNGRLVRLNSTISGITTQYNDSKVQLWRNDMRPHIVRKTLSSYGYEILVQCPVMYAETYTLKIKYNNLTTTEYGSGTNYIYVSEYYPADAVLRMHMVFHGVEMQEYILNLDDEIIT